MISIRNHCVRSDLIHTSVDDNALGAAIDKRSSRAALVDHNRARVALLRHVEAIENVGREASLECLVLVDPRADVVVVGRHFVEDAKRVDPDRRRAAAAAATKCHGLGCTARRLAIDHHRLVKQSVDKEREIVRAVERAEQKVPLFVVGRRRRLRYQLCADNERLIDVCERERCRRGAQRQFVADRQKLADKRAVETNPQLKAVCLCARVETSDGAEPNTSKHLHPLQRKRYCRRRVRARDDQAAAKNVLKEHEQE